MALGNDLNELLRTASNLKSAQVEGDRRRFAGWPRYLQNSLFVGPHVADLWPQTVVAAACSVPARLWEPSRASIGRFADGPDEQDSGSGAVSTAEAVAGLARRLAVATRLKTAGNTALDEERFEDAITQYSEALAVFVRIVSVDGDGWRKGIRDENLRMLEETGVATELHEPILELKRSLYLNLSKAAALAADYPLAIAAASDALRIDPNCTKALVRRAEARVAPASAGNAEAAAAEKDLAAAAALAPEDKYIARKLAELRHSMRQQEARDKSTFAGLFNRGEIVAPHEIEEQRKRDAERRQASNAHVQGVAANGIPSTLAGGGPDAEIERLERLAAEWEAAGRAVEAAELRETIAKAVKSRNAAVRKIDFRHPTKQMIEEARRSGIDLTDPAIQEELQRLEEEKLGEATTTTTTSQPSKGKPLAVGAAAGAPVRRSTTEPVKAAAGQRPSTGASKLLDSYNLEAMPKDILRKILDQHFTAEQLDGMSAADMRENIKHLVAQEEARVAKRQALATKIKWGAITLVMSIVVYRIVSSGLLHALLGWSTPSPQFDDEHLDDFDL